MAKLTKLYTLNVYSILYIHCTSIKLFKERNNFLAIEGVGLRQGRSRWSSNVPSSRVPSQHTPELLPKDPVRNSEE